MAGGTIVVSAIGGALGGALGASVTNAYVREDKSFHIEMLQGGQGVPVVVCNGFLSESGRGWGEWKDIVTKRAIPTLLSTGCIGAPRNSRSGNPRQLPGSQGCRPVSAQEWPHWPPPRRERRSSAHSAPLCLPPNSPRTPGTWRRIGRTRPGSSWPTYSLAPTADSYVLVGHSLGARVAVVTAQTLGTKADGPRVEAAHLTGAAIGAKSDWDTLTARVTDVVYNYHSTNDNVLKYLYGVAAGGRKAAGLIGFTPTPPKLENIDVSAQVQRHSDYFANITLK
jgi:hypothetical protein